MFNVNLSLIPHLPLCFQSQLEDKETEPEDIMECLIKHKTDADMDRKCAAGIEHHQIVSGH